MKKYLVCCVEINKRNPLETLYRALAECKSKAAALREAKLLSKMNPDETFKVIQEVV